MEKQDDARQVDQGMNVVKDRMLGHRHRTALLLGHRHDMMMEKVGRR